MNVPLSDAQKTAIDAVPPGRILTIVDDRTNATYFLVPVADFHSDEWVGPAIDSLKRNDWKDPELDIYSDYDANLRILRGESA
jgi:hypothetical protein